MAIELRNTVHRLTAISSFLAVLAALM